MRERDSAASACASSTLQTFTLTAPDPAQLRAVPGRHAHRRRDVGAAALVLARAVDDGGSALVPSEALRTAGRDLAALAAQVTRIGAVMGTPIVSFHRRSTPRRRGHAADGAYDRRRRRTRPEERFRPTRVSPRAARGGLGNDLAVPRGSPHIRSAGSSGGCGRGAQTVILTRICSAYPCR